MNRQINPDQAPETSQTPLGTNSIWERIIGFLKPPVFEDDFEKTRKASILNAILIAIFVVIALYMISVLFTNKSPLVSLIITILIQVGIIVALVATRRGNVSITANIFMAFIVIVIFGATILFGQAINNPIMPTVILLIFASGYLVSSRAAIFVGLLSLAFFIGFYYIETLVDIPQILEITPLISLSRFTMILLLSIFITYAATNANIQSIAQIKETETALRETNSELGEIRTYLENEVAENTRQIERRSRYLEAASKVASLSVSELDPDKMIDTVAREITEQFGFYHVGIFLLDEQKEWAALRAVSSSGGQQMLARNHRLAVGRQGIVGFVTSMGQARISQDTGDDRVHTPAPELPDTRSEMALPLIARGEIIGAIDIQDTQPEAFTPEDVGALQTMADQIALALENLRLFAQSQENLEEIQRVYGEYSQQAWQETRQRNLLASYRYFGGAVTTIGVSEQTEVLENKVSIPVEVRGTALGAIEISKGEDQSAWSDEELQLLHALALQLGIALDSARLFNESQLRATTEHTISQINSQLWETLDINTMLRTTAQNLRETLALPELTIHMTTPKAETDQSANGKLLEDEAAALNDDSEGND